MKPFRASSVDILSSLHGRYGGHIRLDITIFRIFHKLGRCYLELTSLKNIESQYIRNEIVERIDPEFISDPSISPEISAFENAQVFV